MTDQNFPDQTLPDHSPSQDFIDWTRASARRNTRTTVLYVLIAGVYTFLGLTYLYSGKGPWDGSLSILYLIIAGLFWFLAAQYAKWMVEDRDLLRSLNN